MDLDCTAPLFVLWLFLINADLFIEIYLPYTACNKNNNLNFLKIIIQDCNKNKFASDCADGVVLLDGACACLRDDFLTVD
ncbi:hypothetical protein B0189_04800 [Moraxella cuniculi]|nr:hypothetical protein B0189_04800 [Moraxella cuniculi]